MGKPHWTVKERDYFILHILPRSRCATGKTDMEHGEEWEDLATNMGRAMDERGLRSKGKEYNGDLLYQYWRRVIKRLQDNGDVSTTRLPPPAPLAVSTKESASASSGASSSASIKSVPAQLPPSINQECNTASQEKIRSSSAMDSFYVNEDSDTYLNQQLSSPYNNMAGKNTPPSPPGSSSRKSKAPLAAHSTLNPASRQYARQHDDQSDSETRNKKGTHSQSESEPPKKQRSSGTKNTNVPAAKQDNNGQPSCGAPNFEQGQGGGPSNSFGSFQEPASHGERTSAGNRDDAGRLRSATSSTSSTASTARDGRSSNTGLHDGDSDAQARANADHFTLRGGFDLMRSQLRVQNPHQYIPAGISDQASLDAYNIALAASGNQSAERGGQVITRIHPPKGGISSAPAKKNTHQAAPIVPNPDTPLPTTELADTDTDYRPSTRPTTRRLKKNKSKHGKNAGGDKEEMSDDGDKE